MSNRNRETMEKLREIRIAKKLSQQELADELFVSRSCLSNYETGKRTPPIELLQRMAKLLNVNVPRPSSLENGSNKIEDALNILFQLSDNTIDLSQLSLENRQILMHYYSYLVQRQETEHDEK